MTERLSPSQCSSFFEVRNNADIKLPVLFGIIANMVPAAKVSYIMFITDAAFPDCKDTTLLPSTRAMPAAILPAGANSPDIRPPKAKAAPMK